MEKELNKLLFMMIDRMIEKGISYTQLAKKMKMTVQEVWYILNGYKCPSVSTFLKMAKTLEFKVKIV